MTVDTSVAGVAGFLGLPESVGDFAGLAWFVAGELGNTRGVTGVEVYRFEETLNAAVSVESREAVDLLVAGRGWDVWTAEPGYACASGDLGALRVRVAWMSREHVDRVRAGDSAPSVRERAAAATSSSVTS